MFKSALCSMLNFEALIKIKMQHVNPIYSTSGLLPNEERDLLCGDIFKNTNSFIDPETEITHLWEGSKPNKFVDGGYKVLKSNLTHNGMKYKPFEKNKDHTPFYPQNWCNPGGLYFTDKKDLINYGEYGSLIATIKIPRGGYVYYESSKAKTPEFEITNIEAMGDYISTLPIEQTLQWIQFYPDLINHMDSKYVTDELIFCMEETKEQNILLSLKNQRLTNAQTAKIYQNRY
jgi:hypothetical protein